MTYHSLGSYFLQGICQNRKWERRKFPRERVELVVSAWARATMSGVIPTGVTHSGRKGFGKMQRAMDACARRSSSSLATPLVLTTHVNRSARCARHHADGVLLPWPLRDKALPSRTVW